MARFLLAPVRLAIALALVALGAAASAQEPAGAAPAPAGAPPPAPPPAAAPPAAPSRVPPVQFVAWIGRDFGTKTLVEVEYSDGSTDSLKANEGFIVAVGATFLRRLEGRLETQATIGYKRASLSAANGSVVSSAIPVEVLEAYYAGPVRLAAGLSLQLASKLEGTGAASGLDASFDPSLGLVLQAQWVWRLGAERRWRLDLGGRFTWQALRVSTDQQFTTEANAFGIVFGAAY